MAKPYGLNRTVSGLNVGSEDDEAWCGYRLRMGLGSEFVYGVAAGMAPTVLFLFASKQHWAMVLIVSVAWLAVVLFASGLRSKEQAINSSGR